MITSDNVTDAPYNAFFLIYLLIACNFLAAVFGCKLQHFLQTNMILKHIVGFLLMMFLIIFAEPRFRDTGKYFEATIYSVILYIWFVLTTKTHIYVTIIIITFFMTLYILELWKGTLHQKIDEETINNIKNAQLYITIIAFIITIFGFFQYMMLKQKEYTNDFNITTFVLGKENCSNGAL